MIETNIARDRAQGDLLDFLVADHEEATRLFAAILGTPIGDPERKELMNRITALLVAHAAVEESYLYPILRERVDDGVEPTRRAMDEHAQADVLLRRIVPLDAQSPGFDRLVGVLHEHVTGHMRREEAMIYPLLREELSEDELYQLGDRARALRAHGPTEPPAHAGVEAPADHYWPDQLSASQRLRRLLTPAGGWDRLMPH